MADRVKALADELKRAEARYRALVEQIPAVTYTEFVGNGEMPSYVSPQIHSVLGFTAQEWIADPDLWVSRLHPDDRDRVLARVDRLRSALEPLDIEYRYVARDGRLVWVHDRTSLVCDENGHPVCFQGVMLDITDRKLAEEALQESEAKYRQLFESASDAVVLIDSENGQVLEVNEAACKMYGFTRDEWLNMKNTDVSAEPEETARATAKAVTESHCQIGPSSVLRVPLRWHRKKNGLIFPVEITAGTFFLRGRSVHVAVIRDMTERRRMEETLRLTQYSVDRAGDAIFWIAPDARFIYVNQAACQTLGYTQNELLNMTVSAIDPGFPPEAWDRHWQKLKLLRSFTFESRHRRKDGSEFPVEITVNYLEYEGKEYNCAFARNIEERKRAEMALHQSEERFRRMVESSPLGIISVDTEGYIVDVNQALLDIVGSPSGRVTTDPDALDSAPPHAREAMRADLEKCLREGVSITAEQPYRSSWGKEVYLRYHLVPMHDAAGRIIGAQAMVEDITSLKQTEAALRESEERYRTLVENQGEGVGIVDLNERFLFANPAAHEIFGVPVGDLVGRVLRDFTDEHSYQLILAQSRVRQQRFKSTYELDIIRQSGERRTILVTATPRTDRCGRVVGTFGIFRDITEEKMAKESLRRLSFHDALTGLHNRTYFEEEMRRVEAGREYPVSLVCTDVDGLKLINDTMGHQKGDALLISFAQTLRETFRQTDVIARVGGDEFAVILLRTRRDAAERICRRLDRRVAARNQSFPGLPLSASWGVYTVEKPGLPLDQALRLADHNMYRDKLSRAGSIQHHIIEALLLTLTAKDYVSEGHVRRVRELVVKLAEAVGLPKERTADLTLLAEVHDLGKVGVSDQILFKEGPLDAGEWEQMREHSTIGYRIARSSPELAHIADLILHHHEWWNGDGYPSGLAGHDIPLECRILAIADAFDAMTSDRPYRRSLTQQQAVQAIKDGAGSQFDPDLVSLFLVCVLDEVETVAR